MPIDQTGNYLFSDAKTYPIDKNNVSPRIGASYALDQAATAVVRGGWGLYYQKTAYSNFSNLVSAGAIANSFTVSFPANNVDPGPRAGQFPTNEFLVNGPVVNRSLLNARFPTGTTTKNTGTVNFDSPDRHLPYAREASIGFEKQLAGNISVSADYIHMNQRDLYMQQELNPGLRASPTSTATVTRIDPRFTASVRELTNLGWFDYDGLQLSAHKRFSRHYQFRVSYTRAKGKGNVAAPGATDLIDTQTVDPVSKAVSLNLDNLVGPGSQVRPHVLSMDGSVEVPYTKGLNLSGVMQYQTGTPFTLTDSGSDPDRNGNFQEPLAAGSYSGVGTNAITVDYKGGVRGARGPSYFLTNVRAAYRFRLPGNRTLQAHVDVFNATNHANFNNPNGDRFDAKTFLILRTILNGGPTRTAQFNLKYTF